MELGCFSCSEGDDGSAAVTMYIFGTLFVLMLLFLLDNMEMTEIDGEHAC